MKNKYIIFICLFVFSFIFGILPASASTLSDGIYEIQSALDSSMYVDLYAGNTKNGSNIQLYKGNHQENQRWYIKSVSDGYYTITSYKNNNYSFDIYGARTITAGSNVQLYNFNNGDNQKWLIKETSDGYYNIISKVNNLYLDVANSGTINCTNIIVWTGNGGNNQKFKLVNVTNNYDVVFPKKTIEDGNYFISSLLDNNKNLNISGNIKNEANVNISSSKNTLRQIWNVKYLGNGYYSILSAYNNNYSLDLYGAKTITKGTNVQIYNSNNGNNQKWVIKDAGDGYYYIVSKTKNLYLDIYNNQTKDGTNVEVWSANAGKNQKFKFIDANEALNNLNDYENVKPSKSIEDGNYIITSSTDGNLAVSIDGNFNNSSNVKLLNKNNSLKQIWTIKYLSDGYYSITSLYNSNYSLDIYGAKAITKGTNVQIYNSNNGDNQKWIIKKTYDGYYYVVSKNNWFLNYESNNNIDVNNGDGSYNEKFSFEKTNVTKASSDYYAINNSNNEDMGLNVYGRYKDNGTKVQLYKTSNSVNELWKFNFTTDGFYIISSALNPKLVLDVNGGLSANGTDVNIFRQNNGNNQKWILISNEDGTYSFISKTSSKYLTTTSYNSGSKLTINSLNNNLYQKFKLNKYSDKKRYNGIDISYWQSVNKEIDWSTLSKSGVDFVIVRAGFGDDESSQDDKRFIDNVSYLEKYNIPYAVYIYSYANKETGSSSAVSEANHVIRLLKQIKQMGYSPNLNAQVFYDMEDKSVISAGKNTLTNVAFKFCSLINQNGYSCGIYANTNWFTKYLDVNKIKKSYKIWLANYPAGTFNFSTITGINPNYGSSGLTSFNYWQFCSDGTINGIDGYIDLDIGYDIFD